MYLRLQLSWLPILIAVLLCAFDSGVVNAQSDGVQCGSEATWLRRTIQIDGVRNADVELRFATTAISSVYFNGQRLIRNRPVDGVVAWNVSKLIRNGNNCIAVAVAEGAKDRQLASWFETSELLKLQSAPWKASTAVPPVGWQQTDFNDRDWTAAAVVSKDKIQFSATVHQLLPWESVVARSHVSEGRFRFLDGDHVVFLGGTFIERAQEYGYLESALTAAAAPQNVTFRNLGWSADTVFAESRGIFDSPARGYERMVEHVRAEEPSVVFLCYGQNEAMSFGDGPAAIDRFKTQLQILKNDVTTGGAEMVLLTPHPFVPMAPPLPDATRWNNRLKMFSDAVKEVAAESGVAVVDLFTDMTRDMATVQFWATAADELPANLGAHPDLNTARNSVWTDNGMHWNDAGYQSVAAVMASRLLQTSLERPSVSVDPEKRTVVSDFGSIRNVNWQPSAGRVVTFEFRSVVITSVPLEVLFFSDLKNQLAVTAVLNATKKSFGFEPVMEYAADHQGTRRFVADEAAEFRELRELVRRKNELYFHRWRPQNITYLFGFRKHEQGNNASEIAQFDPLIDQLEQQIQAAKQPKWQTIAVSTDE